MCYSGYCNFNSSEELVFDNLRVQENRDQLLTNILSSKDLGYAFLLGNTVVVLFDALPAYADDLETTKQAKKALAKRISNVIGCGAITLACGKATQAGPPIVEVAAKEVNKIFGNEPNNVLRIIFTCKFLFSILVN